jgi:hypothetical protein
MDVTRPATWNLLLDGLLLAHSEKRLGHALLLVTENEESPQFSSFLKALFRGLLCLNQGVKACGECVSCKLMDRDWTEFQHPDSYFLKPDNSKGYSVEQIRSLISSFQLTRSLSPARLCRLQKAELLSASGGAAANALLKLLEEPRPQSFLVLTTSHVEGVLPTLRSRCQSFKLSGGGVPKPVDEGWSDFISWTLRGATALPIPLCPADSESFWGERDEVLAELEEVYNSLWLQSKVAMGALPRESSLRVLYLFAEFETLIKKIRGFAAPALQWSNFKTQLYGAAS